MLVAGEKNSKIRRYSNKLKESELIEIASTASQPKLERHLT